MEKKKKTTRAMILETMNRDPLIGMLLLVVVAMVKADLNEIFGLDSIEATTLKTYFDTTMAVPSNEELRDAEKQKG